MTDVEIVNPVPVDESRAWLAALSPAFLDQSGGDLFDRMAERWQREWFPNRTWGARAGGQWVASLTTSPRSISIPAGLATTTDVEVDALTEVSVSPTHRRRGIMRSLMTESLRSAKERGEPFSILITSQWPIYGRFGYAPASAYADYTLLTGGRGGWLLGPSGSGSIRHADPQSLGAIAPAVFDRVRRLRSGGVDRRDEWWPRRLGLNGYRPINPAGLPNYYVRDGAEGPDGLLWWSGTRGFELNGDLGAVQVGGLFAATDDAYRDLWAFMCSFDLAGEVRIGNRSTDEPARWLLTDGRALRQTYAGDHTWLRLLDVPAALTARGYAVPGRLVLEVVDDDLGGYGAGRFRLDADAEGAQCRATSAGADLRLTQRALASVYLGGHTLRGQRLSASVAELTPGALGLADAMFATPLAPWNATGF